MDANGQNQVVLLILSVIDNILTCDNIYNISHVVISLSQDNVTV